MEQNTMEQILQELKDIKKGLPNGELKRMETSMKLMEKDIAEMKRILLDPKDGLIVETNKNTEFRVERSNKIPFYDAQVNELEKLKEWKSGVTRALWISFTAIIGIIVKMFTSNS